MFDFEKALRTKVRFDTNRGLLTIEDLWDLPLTSDANKANLDDIARGLNRKLRSGDDVSYVTPERKSDETIQMQFDLVKYVIDVRLADRKAASEVRERAAKKQRLMEIVAGKEDESLKSMSIEDLRKAIAEL